MPRLEVFLINYLFTLVSAFCGVLIIQAIYHLKFRCGQMAAFTLLVSLIISNTLYHITYLGLNITFILVLIIAFLISTVILIKLVLGLELIRSVVSAVIYALILGLSFAVSYFMQVIFGLESKCIEDDLWQFVLIHIIINVVNIAMCITIKSFKSMSVYPHEIRKKAYTANTLYIIFAIVIALYNIWHFYSLSSYELSRVIFVFDNGLLLSFFIIRVSKTNTFFNFAYKSRELDYHIFYNKTLRGIINDMRVFKHNYDNMLASIKSLVEARQIDELERYINEIVEKKNKTDGISNIMLLNIKNAGILGILAFKAENAKKLGIDIKIEVKDEIMETNVKISDLCEILGILLDNAIEAACESKNRFVNLRITKNEGTVTFIVENSVEEKPEVGRIFEKGYSTKGDNRGLGLWILKRIINNYNNIMLNTLADGKMFRQELIII